jgi:hypothetical protein
MTHLFEQVLPSLHLRVDRHYVGSRFHFTDARVEVQSHMTPLIVFGVASALGSSTAVRTVALGLRFSLLQSTTTSFRD